MRFVYFTHSLLSDWNHGNAHFLRGVFSELLRLGHEVTVYEPEEAWSLQNLLRDKGEEAVAGFHRVYPNLQSTLYNPALLDLPRMLGEADIVVVHEWNPHALVAQIGAHKASGGHYKLLFHDTHHRAATEPEGMAQYDLSHYDGVLAFGAVVRDLYLKNGWAKRAWVWHEAADTRVFTPRPETEKTGDLVWVGNWGDNERTEELHEFLLNPVKALGLKAKVHGVRYPGDAQKALADAGIEYGDYLPNYEAPEVFARYKMTVHVPRRPYVRALPGIPTIRVFEALACGIPLVCAPWSDAENLFTPGKDYLTAQDGGEMTERLQFLRDNPAEAEALAAHGRRTIEQKHTCAHRAQELTALCKEL